MVLDRGEGVWLFDVNQKRYLDFISGIGVNSLGYSHPRVSAVIAEQAKLLIHASNLYYHPYQAALARRLAAISGLKRVFFANSGGEMVEAALKIAKAHGRRRAHSKFGIVALRNSFHGRSIGGTSVSGLASYREEFEPLLPGVTFVDRESEEELGAAFTGNTAGMILEVIQGHGGIHPLSANYLRRARELCDRFDAILIFDETQCGLGRTGSYFAYQDFEPPVVPDVVIGAKGIGCGLPLGFLAANERGAAALRPGIHGSTFGGGPLSCRLGLEFLDILDELLPRIRQVGAYLRMRLQELGREFSIIRDVRGRGLIAGVELTVPAAPVVECAMYHGVLLNCTNGKVLRFLPPYTMTESHVDEGVSILATVVRQLHPG